MKHILKNRVFLGLICIGLSLVICFGLTPLWLGALKSKTEVIRISTDVKKGDEITSNMISRIEVGAYNLPSNIVYKESDVVGKYANADLYKGDYVLQSKLSDTPMLQNEYLSGLNGDNMAISFTIKYFAAGLSDKLQRGDIVSLIASDKDSSENTTIPKELKYVEVIATTSNTGYDRNPQNKNEETEADLASTITVLATPEQARIIGKLEQVGVIHTALVYRGNKENADKFLEMQKQILEGN